MFPQDSDIEDCMNKAIRKLSESHLENNTKHLALLCDLGEEKEPEETVVVFFFKEGKASIVSRILYKNRMNAILY